MFSLRDPSPPIPTGRSAPAPVRDPAARRILVVEDSDALRAVAVEILTTRGYAVSEARHGEEAMRVIERAPEPFDLVVTEVSLPVMSGYLLGRRLGREQAGLPVLYVSSAGHERLIRLGALPARTRILRKPYRPEELARQVLEQLRPSA